MKQVWIIAQHTIKALIRKKDFYVFFMMLIILLALLFSENFFGVQGISRYLKDIGFFCLWLFSLIIAVTFSTKQLPEEMESKTICPLLAKPVSRTHLVVGRFLGSVFLFLS
ncbi:ABC transporter permease subunit [bacterium]|nr:ABC transporter permease subunit [bacterium]